MQLNETTVCIGLLEDWCMFRVSIVSCQSVVGH